MIQTSPILLMIIPFGRNRPAVDNLDTIATEHEDRILAVSKSITMMECIVRHACSLVGGPERWEVRRVGFEKNGTARLFLAARRLVSTQLIRRLRKLGQT